MKPMRRLCGQLLLVLGVILGMTAEAHAIIGRPLTPFSVAGVARRSVRRGYYGAGVYGAPVARGVAYGAAVGAAAAVSAVPAGCVVGAPCGGVTYNPYYAGPQVVYAPSY